MTAMRAGNLRERLVIQENAWPALDLTLTREAGTATGTTKTAHDYTTGDYVTVTGGVPAGYNGRVKVTVTGTRTFTYPVDAGLATPATGTVTVRFATDAQGGRREHWQDLVRVPAELLTIGANERLQMQAITAHVAFRFRVRRRADLHTQMRARWRPTWPPAAPALTLEVRGVTPEGHGRTTMLLDCSGID